MVCSTSGQALQVRGMINRWMIKDFTGARATVNCTCPGMSVSRGETCRSERVQGAKRPASWHSRAKRTAWYTGWYRTGLDPALMSGMSMASLLVCLTIPPPCTTRARACSDERLTSRGRWNTHTRTQACAHVSCTARGRSILVCTHMPGMSASPGCTHPDTYVLVCPICPLV